MKYLLIVLISVSFFGCSGMSARRTWLGNWKEQVEVQSFVVDKNTKKTIGYFTLKQHQVYWGDELDNCDLGLAFTNTTNQVVSFNFQINFALNVAPRKYLRRGNNDRRRGGLFHGHWTYTNAVVLAQPNETKTFGHISDRIVSIKDGGIYTRLTTPVTYEE